MATVQVRRLPLNTTYNTRDLGGYRTTNGEVTKWKAFLRSDDVSFVNESDIQFLKEYGIGTVIDLRSEEEINRTGYTLASQSDITVYNLPLNAGNVTDATKITTMVEEDFLPKFYVQCIEQKDQIREIFMHMMAASKNGVLFHCAAGKDRTGIISALLLGLVGVPTQDILSDYEVTYGYIKENPTFKQHLPKIPESLLYSSREYMEYALTHLEENYGGISNYFNELNLDPIKLQNLKHSFVS